VNTALSFVAGVGLISVAVRAIRDLADQGDYVPLIVVGSFTGYVLAAEIARSRARIRRGPTTTVAVGLAQWAPAFSWVPYGVIAFHLGPELDPSPLRALGIALTVGGIAFALWALAAIGRHFDLALEVHEGHEVVRVGPYRFVRHPIYAGLLVHTAGAALATGNVLFAAGSLLVTIPVLYLRARTEERMLRADLGAAYDEYAREVGMLVPFIGRT